MMDNIKYCILLLSVGTILASCSPATITTDATDDATAAGSTKNYPTSTRADYVIGCMAVNGQTPEILQKCSCSIDFIAARIPYAEYEQVEALLRMQQMPGVGRNAVYKNSAWAKNTVLKLREIQAESTLRCF